MEAAIDVAIHAMAQAHVAHCPVSLARWGMHLHHLSGYLAHGINVGLGTALHPFDLIREMRDAGLVGKVAAESPNAVTARDVFNAATWGGATALGRPDLGRLCPGATADMVIVNQQALHYGVIRDPIRSLVDCGVASDDLLFTFGRDMQLTTYAWIALLSAVCMAAAAILIRQGLRQSNAHTGYWINLVVGVSGLWIAVLLLAPGDVWSFRALPFFILSGLVGTVGGRFTRFIGIDKVRKHRGLSIDRGVEPRAGQCGDAAGRDGARSGHKGAAGNKDEHWAWMVIDRRGPDVEAQRVFGLPLRVGAAKARSSLRSGMPLLPCRTGWQHALQR